MLLRVIPITLSLNIDFNASINPYTLVNQFLKAILFLEVVLSLRAMLSHLESILAVSESPPGHQKKLTTLVSSANEINFNLSEIKHMPHLCI